MLELYGIIGALVLIVALIIWLWVKDHQKQKRKATAATEKAQAAEKKEQQARENIEAVLDYDKQDSYLVKQREKHVEALVKTRSEANAEKEIQSLMADLRTAYNSQ